MASQSIEGPLGLALVLCLVALAAGLVLRSGLSRPVKTLALAALLLRVVGSFAYYELMQAYFGGGDYLGYHGRGLEYAERLGHLDFSMFVNADEWVGGSWWATQFVFFPTGLIIALFGPNVLSGFVLFSMLAFLGLIGFAVAFHRNFPEVPVRRYLCWIWLFPSLWFWPAAIGKDALLLCGLGIAVWGFAGGRSGIGWLLACGGILLVFAVRPQVAAVVAFAMVLAQWAAGAGQWTSANSVQSVLFLVVGLVAIHFGMAAIGAGGIDAEGVSGYVESRSQSVAVGVTNVAGTGTDWTGIPMAMVNILFRPVPFESWSVTVLLAGVELWCLWAVAVAKRGNIVAALREWRSSRLLTLAVVFVVVYSAALGMVVVNLGIIARQRIFLFPFIFVLFEARPQAVIAAQLLPRIAAPRRVAPRGRPAAGTSGGT